MRRARMAGGLFLALACSYAGVAAASPQGDGWQITTLPVNTHGTSSYSEPGIAVGPRGTLIANACTANAGGPSTFWLSRDNGRSWSTGFPVGTSAIGCGDSDAVVGSDGYLYSLTLGTGVEVYRSRDGVHWEGPASFPPPHGEDQPDRPWLVTVPQHPSTVLMFNSEGAGDVVEWRSTDHAKTFTGPISVTDDPLMLGSRPLFVPGDPLFGYKPYLEMFYEAPGGAGSADRVGASGPAEFPLGRLDETASDDGGLSWPGGGTDWDVTKAFHVRSGSIGHLLPAAAVDGDGRTYVVVSARLGESPQTHLYLFFNNWPVRGGNTFDWSPPVRIDRGLSSNVFPAIAATSPGHLFISWYGSDAKDFDDPNARWFEEYAETTDGLATHPRFAQRQLGGDVPVHVGGIDNLGNVGSTLGQDWGLRDFQSIVVDTCGHPHVIWARDYDGARTFTATTTPFCDTE